MQKYISLMFISMLWLGTQAYAQTYNGDLVLSTQAQINAFKYTEVTGKLTIGGQSSHSNITDLSPLNKLRSAGSLYILTNNNLPSLLGLESLTTIKQVLYISSSDALKDMQGLNNLQTIGDNFYISYNDGLVNLEGLSKLQSIGRDFFISTNAALQSLNGIGALQTIGGSLIIMKNKKLSDVEEISHIKRIPGNLVIRGNKALASCCWLKQVTIGYGKDIRDNAPGCRSWENICPSEKVYDGDLTLSTQAEVDNFKYTQINGSLSIGNPFGEPNDINDLSALSVLESVQELWIHDCNQLQSLHGLEKLKEIANGVYIDNNAKLENMQGLNGLESVGDYRITNNPALLNLEGLENLRDAFDLEISYNDNLQNLQGLESLEAIVFLELSDNKSLTNIKGLKSMQSPTYSIIINNNSALKDLQGLENIQEVDEAFYISNNSSLTSLSGLDNLQTIYESLVITGNASLSSIEALANLQQVYQLYIARNTSLNACCVLLNVRAANIDITDNAPGCNGEEEIQDSCTPSANVSSLAQGNRTLPYSSIGKLQAYPNPVDHALHLQGYTGTAIIKNALGQTIKQLELSGMDEIDLSGIPAGMYILQTNGYEPVSIIKQ